jgi:GT2 family glycosyltransferase
MDSKVKVSIIIAVYRQVDYTKLCVKSIQEYTDIPYELIVVDNGSKDGTADFLKTVDARVITNAENKGCAVAWNQGIKSATGPYICIINNDTVVTPGWLSGLTEFMEKRGYHIVSPAVVEGPLYYDLYPYAADYTKKCMFLKRHLANACCMLIKREVFERVGLFDEQFIYGGYEDIDFFWRCKQAGLSMATTGASLIHHFSMKTQNEIKKTDHFDYDGYNKERFYKKWGRAPDGGWFERKNRHIMKRIIQAYQRLFYGHALIEKGRKFSKLRLRKYGYKDESHPEKLVLLPYCVGKGIEIGCGHRKTSENCIGVDIIPRGEKGKYGCVTGQVSVADIQASGDELFMFKDQELDFVISRHNLEHYIDVVKTLQEWKRVLRIGGVMANVLPDETNINTIPLDPTHKHVFTPESYRRLLELIGGFEILKMEVVIPDWSFICVARRIH